MFGPRLQLASLGNNPLHGLALQSFFLHCHQSTSIQHNILQSKESNVQEQPPFIQSQRPEPTFKLSKPTFKANIQSQHSEPTFRAKSPVNIQSQCLTFRANIQNQRPEATSRTSSQSHRSVFAMLKESIPLIAGIPLANESFLQYHWKGLQQLSPQVQLIYQTTEDNNNSLKQRI